MPEFPLRRRIRRALRGLLWRGLRRLQDGFEANATPATGIERFFVFNGTLHLAGTLKTTSPIAALALELAGGHRLVVPFAVDAKGAVRFDAMPNTTATAAEIAQSCLVATLVGGSELRHDGLGTAHGDGAHAVGARFRNLLAERPPGRLLELGARARSGVVRRDWQPPGWDYSGFDIRAGANVDVVGDAHTLSQHYAPESFDAVMAFSVLEHLLMPWKAALEINRVLKTGGIGLFTTHQAWPLHDAPWDFWRFSDAAWTGLLNEATGFEIIEAQLGEPAFIVPLRCSPATAFPERPGAALASFVLFRKTGSTKLTWPVDLGAILRTSYPSAEMG